jgi:hypothetical protein
VLHAAFACTNTGRVNKKQWVEGLIAAMTVNQIQCMPGSHRSRITYRQVVRLVGHSLPIHVITGRPGSLKRSAIEAEILVGQAVKQQAINFGYKIPFTQIPKMVEEGFQAQDKAFVNGDQKVRCHYHVSRNCLERNLGDPLCDLLLMLVLTFSASSVTPTVGQTSGGFEGGPHKQPGIFAANLVTRMLWFLHPKSFPWEEDDGMVLRVSEMTKKIEHKGVNNRLLREMGWIISSGGRKYPRNSEIRLRPVEELMRLRKELLQLRGDAVRFIEVVFRSSDRVWVERCSSIIREKQSGSTKQIKAR